MKVSLEKIENNTAYLNLEVDKEQFEAALEQAYRKNAKHFTIPGFRKGKAPRFLVERYYGPEILYEDAAEAVLPDAYEKGIKDLKLEPVDRPRFDITQIEKGKSLIATVQVTIKPEATVKQYEGLEVDKYVYNVNDDDIERELKTLQEKNARLVTVEDRPAKMDDIAIIDFEGSVDEIPFEGGKGENYSLTLGSGMFIPGFEEQVVGMQVNETKDIKVTFPEDYHQKDLAGKEATFKTSLKEIKKKDLLPLDDEFAKDVSEFDSLEELKADIKRTLEERAHTVTEGSLKASIINKLLENTEVEVPEVMVEREIDRLVMDTAISMRMQGFDLETYLKVQNISIQDFRTQFKDRALENVKSSLALEEVAKQEKIEVSEEEVEEEIEKMSKNVNKELEEFKKDLRPEDIDAIKDKVLTQKIFDFLIEKAVITEKVAETSKEEEEDK